MTTQQTPPAVNLLVKKTESFPALCFTTRTTLPQLPHFYGHVANELQNEATRLKLDVTGPIQWIYTGVNGDETNEFQLEIVLPIHQPAQESGAFTYRVFPAFRCASYLHSGSWHELGAVYNVLFPEFYREGYQNDGRIREIYAFIDLENPANCVTEIQIGIALTSQLTSK